MVTDRMGMTTWLNFWRTAGRSFRWVWVAARRQFVITLVAELIAAMALAVVLLCARSIAEALTGDEPLESVTEIWPEVACLAAALLGSGISLVVQREIRPVVTEQVLRYLETEIIEIAGSVEYQRFEEHEFNDILDRAIDEGAERAMQMAYDILGVANSLVGSVALLAVLWSATPGIVPALVLLGVPFVIAARLSARMAFRLAHELTPGDRLRGSLFGTLTDSGSAKEVRVFDLRPSLTARWSALYSDRIERMERVALKRILFNGLASLAAAGLVAVLLVVVVDAAIDGRVALADGAIAIVALQQLSQRIRTTAQSTGSLREAVLFLDEFEEFRAKREIGNDGDPEAVPLDPFEVLRVEDVTFRYPGTERLVLDGVNLEIRAGEIVALVGLSGSGKSTLSHLVGNLYRPTTGRITWDGVDITTIDRASYWRSLGVIYQNYVSYALAARENIAIADHRIADDHQAIQVAAIRAGIHEVIVGLDQGYDTMLSREYEGGADLSQGEWQRLAVARAFFRQAPLLILDEPASALDPLAERRLYDSLADLSSERSVLLISHRFSTVRLADRIYLLHNGVIAEQGGHDELMALDGHYANMFRAQASGFIEVPDR